VSNPSSSQEMRRELGRRLREVRRQAGLSQQQVGRRTGYTRSAISNAEAGGYARRQFWERCDDLFSTGGSLARGHDEIHQRAAGGPTRRKPGHTRNASRQVLDQLHDAHSPGAASQALAAYQALGWPVEERQERLALVTGTVIDALELPRPAGALAISWWLYTGGAADGVRGLPALPRPDQALAVVETGPSFFFIAQASSPWDALGIPAPPRAPVDAGSTIRWHCLGSRIPVPPAQGGDGQPARWAYLPSQRVRLAPAIGLLDLLAKAAATVRHSDDALAFARDVLVIPVHGQQPSPAPG
jgi:DNA-binding XRE family transcriptional regulator